MVSCPWESAVQRVLVIVGLLVGVAWGQAAPDPLGDLLGGLTLDDVGGVPGEAGEGPADEAPTMGGLWVYPDPAGPTRYLELYGGERFVYRDGQGGITAGQAVTGPGRLILISQGQRRVFACTLGATGLELLCDPADRPVDGPLATMPPVGAAIVVWRRRGQGPPRWSLPLEAGSLLQGEFVCDAGGGRREMLGFGPRDTCRYRGPGEVAAVGRYRFDEGRLILSSGSVERQFSAELGFTPTGWRLRLERTPEDLPRPANDLADMSPLFRRFVEYRRPLDAVLPADLVGPYQTDGPLGPERLVFQADGTVRWSVGSTITPLTWSLDGAVLTLQLSDELGPIATRRLWVQRLPGGLAAIPYEDRAAPPNPLLGDLPPATAPFAWWAEP